MVCEMAHHSHPQTLFKFLSHLTLFHLSQALWYIDTFLLLLLKWLYSNWLSLDLLFFSPCILSRETSPILMAPSNIILAASGSFHGPHLGSLQEDHIHHVFSYILHTQPFQTTSSLSFLHKLLLKVLHSNSWVTVCLVTPSMTLAFSLLSPMPTTFTTQSSAKLVLSLSCCPLLQSSAGKGSPLFTWEGVISPLQSLCAALPFSNLQWPPEN